MRESPLTRGIASQLGTRFAAEASEVGVTSTGNPPCQTMPEMGSTSAVELVRLQTFGSPNPCGIDTEPCLIDEVIIATAVTEP